MAFVQPFCSSTWSWRCDRSAQHSHRCHIFARPQRSTQHSQHIVAVKAASILEAVPTKEEQEQQYVWQGDDEFTNLNDRHDATPIPLPAISRAKRVVLVRHGQSTWNAIGRVQGSSNLAVLTSKGIAQAETTHELLQPERFDILYYSPLARASQTATIVWGDRKGRIKELPSLREIDLYNFQGLFKHEGKERYGEQFRTWQTNAASFEIGGHAPVRELWHRGSLAWTQLLQDAQDESSIIIVAHNAVNQAMVATALGLPPTYFRRMLQSNAATTVIDLQPNGSGPPTATLNRLNQAPGRPFTPSAETERDIPRIILVRNGATVSSEDGIMMGSGNDPLTTLGEIQAQKTGEVLMDLKVDVLMTSPQDRAYHTAKDIAKLQSLAGERAPVLQPHEGLRSRCLGDWEGRLAAEVRGTSSPPSAEPLQDLMKRVQPVWDEAIKAATDGGPHTVVISTHSTIVAAMVCMCLGLPHNRMSTFRTDPGSISILEMPFAASGNHQVVLRCMNYTAHLGRWSVPITRDDPDSDILCGIEGCF